MIVRLMAMLCLITGVREATTSFKHGTEVAAYYGYSRLSSIKYRQLASSKLDEVFEFGSNFTLPTKKTKYPLEVINRHVNDQYVSFRAIDHRYFYKDITMARSVTGIVKRYFEKFDSIAAVNSMMNGPNWPRPQYTHNDGTPLSSSEILSKWDEDGELARNKGTWMHFQIERYLNELQSSMDDVETKQFLSFHREVICANNITPYRTEWCIVAPDLELGGSVDFVGRCSDGRFVLIDWKRSSKVVTGMHTSYGKYAKPPVSHLPDCIGSLYILQLNMYRYILRKYYDIDVSRMILASFHPDLEDYFMVEVPVLDSEIGAIVTDISNKRFKIVNQ